jgi:phosphinothricin acetyltransferase
MNLRVASEADAEAVAAIYRPYVEETAITFEETPPEAEEMRSRIAETLETYPWFVAERESAGEGAGDSADDGERESEVVGYAYAGKLRKRAAYRWVVELSVYVARDCRREGVGRALYRALLSTLARQGFRSAYGVVTLPNPASVAFHEELGFERAALLPEAGYKLGEWHDVAWFERALDGERPADPADPTPFADCRDAAWLAEALADAPRSV